MRGLLPDEVSRLKGIDTGFFGRELSAPLGKMSLLDGCLMYPGLAGERMIELANRVVVPDAAVDKTKEILSGLERPPPVVSLTELAKS
jgi:hypothetical protein